MTELYRGPIVAIFGPIGSGKTTTARALVSGHKFIKVSFADALRDEVSSALAAHSGIVDGKAKDRILNEMVDPLSKEHYRPILQWWGSYRRGQNLDYWVQIVLPYINNIATDGKGVVIDDCRYANEYKALSQYGASFYRLDPNPEVAIDATSEPHNHASEKDWAYFLANRTLAWDQVIVRVEQILGDLRSRDLL